MLLTLTTTHSLATDLGYLLHKNPSRPQWFDLSVGRAHVFYPEADPDRCTAALMLEIDPVGLVRNRRGPSGEGFSLEQYVNDRPELLEHPQQAFDYFRSQGVGKVICEEKHMGSRAVTVICRDEQTAQRRFGIRNDGIGILFTRTGRRFFNERAVESELLNILHQALTAAGFWEQFQTDWFCLDCELMPWSAKAQDLLRTQYAAVGSASRAAASVSILEQAVGRYTGTVADDLQKSLERQQDRLIPVNRYVEAYRHYCWPVHSVNDLKLAPFHLLARMDSRSN